MITAVLSYKDRILLYGQPTRYGGAKMGLLYYLLNLKTVKQAKVLKCRKYSIGTRKRHVTGNRVNAKRRYLIASIRVAI